MASLRLDPPAPSSHSMLDAPRRSSVARRTSSILAARRRSSTLQMRRVSLRDGGNKAKRTHRNTQAIMASVMRPQQTDGGNASNFHKLTQMQKRFDSTASSIQAILSGGVGGYEDKYKKKKVLVMFGGGVGRMDEDSGQRMLQQQAQQTAKITSQLALWKDDVAKLLDIVDDHITRCSNLEQHEVQMSHQNKDSPLDVRRKRINEFVLSLKADLRALHSFISTKHTLEDYEAVRHGWGGMGMGKSIDINDRDYQAGTKSYWRERALILERLLAEVVPTEPSVNHNNPTNSAYNGEPEEDTGSSTTMNGSGSGSGSGSGNDKGGGYGAENETKRITANQIVQLYDMRQSLMQEIVEYFKEIHSDFEVEYDGGADRVVETILKNDKEKREISSFVRSFLGVSENIESVIRDCTEKYRFMPDLVKEGMVENSHTESIRKEMTKISFDIKRIEGELEALSRAKNDYKNKEIRRGVLQRWRVRMDEHEVSLKILAERGRTLEEEKEKLEMEEERLVNSIVGLRDAAHEGAETHEHSLKRLRPKIVKFIDEAVGHKETIEGLLLSVNLTTGLFKKREFALTNIEKKIDKTRSARAQIESERKKNQLDYAILHVDSKRNAKILEVALAANKKATEAFNKERHALSINEQEAENLRSQLESANEERLTYEKNMEKKRGELEDRRKQREFLDIDVRRMKGVLSNLTEQVDEVLERFNDAKMLKLKDTLEKIRAQEKVNKNLRTKLVKTRKKVKKLESSIVGGQVDKHYLAEFMN